MSLDKDVFSHVAIPSNSYDPKLWEGLCYGKLIFNSNSYHWYISLGCRLTVNDTVSYYNINDTDLFIIFYEGSWWGFVVIFTVN